MHARCYNVNHAYFSDYGGRGIIVDERWHSLESFLNDMSPRPDGHSLERINNDSSYSLENCRWATQTEQIRNRRSTLMLDAFGENKSLGEWLEDARCVVPYNTLYRRVSRGVEAEKALSSPKRQGKKFDIGSVTD